MKFKSKVSFSGNSLLWILLLLALSVMIGDFANGSNNLVLVIIVAVEIILTALLKLFPFTYILEEDELRIWRFFTVFRIRYSAISEIAPSASVKWHGMKLGGSRRKGLALTNGQFTAFINPADVEKFLKELNVKLQGG